MSARSRTGSSRGGGVLVGALAVDSVGIGLFLPLSLVYFLRLTDVPLALLGGLLSLANLITLPLPIWAGAMADRVGALPLVVAAHLLQSLGFLGYAFVTGPVSVFAAAALVAIGVRLFWSTVFTAVADYADASASAWTKDTWYAVSNGARHGAVRRLKAQDGADILVFGSVPAWNDLLAAGLVDELHVMVGNGVLGDGVPAFTVGLLQRLPLQETRRLEGSDNVLLVYFMSDRA